MNPFKFDIETAEEYLSILQEKLKLQKQEIKNLDGLAQVEMREAIIKTQVDISAKEHMIAEFKRDQQTHNLKRQELVANVTKDLPKIKADIKSLIEHPKVAAEDKKLLKGLLKRTKGTLTDNGKVTLMNDYRSVYQKYVQ